MDRFCGEVTAYSSETLTDQIASTYYLYYVVFNM